MNLLGRVVIVILIFEVVNRIMCDLFVLLISSVSFKLVRGVNRSKFSRYHRRFKK